MKKEFRLLDFSRKTVRLPDDWLVFLNYPKTAVPHAELVDHTIIIKGRPLTCQKCGETVYHAPLHLPEEGACFCQNCWDSRPLKHLLQGRGGL